MLNSRITSLLLALLCISSNSFAKEERPNIIIMMLDDLGYSDFGCYGSEIKTPHIDSLAENGLRFRNFYNTAKCHSSRVSLLTGLYSDQAGDNAMNRGSTIAEELKESGYATIMVGKWHVSKSPTERGFEKYFGHLSGATNFFTGDKTFRLNDQPWNNFDDDFYTTDANITWATKFLADSFDQSPEKPFFLYIAHNAPHYPLHAKKEDFDKYEGIYDAGWDKLREARYAKQLKMGIIPTKWKLSSRPQNVPAWEKVEDKKWEIERMQAFAAMVDSVDQNTGKLVEFLKSKGKFENTLILICSDNGACPFDRTRGKEFRPWDPKSYWCYDTGWSHLGNTPFRLHKQNQHAGGINSPLIAHWPKGIKRELGSVVTGHSHLVDFMPTCLDLAKTEYSAKEPLQGMSLKGILKGEDIPLDRELFFRFSSNRALIQGNWKLVTHRASQWELYNIVEDGTELNDLSKTHPNRVKEMSARWTELASKIGRLKEKNISNVSGRTIPILQKDGRPENLKNSKKKK